MQRNPLKYFLNIPRKQTKLLLKLMSFNGAQKNIWPLFSYSHKIQKVAELLKRIRTRDTSRTIAPERIN
jgi:hypothetical protein